VLAPQTGDHQDFSSLHHLAAMTIIEYEGSVSLGYCGFHSLIPKKKKKTTGTRFERAT
jgi:hypothetical protein